MLAGQTIVDYCILSIYSLLLFRFTSFIFLLLTEALLRCRVVVVAKLKTVARPARLKCSRYKGYLVDLYQSGIWKFLRLVKKVQKQKIKGEKVILKWHIMGIQYFINLCSL